MGRAWSNNIFRRNFRQFQTNVFELTTDNDLEPASWFGGIFVRRDALPCPAEAPWRKLMRVPNMKMTRNAKNGDARKRIPPSNGWPTRQKYRPFCNIFGLSEMAGEVFDPIRQIDNHDDLPAMEFSISVSKSEIRFHRLQEGRTTESTTQQTSRSHDNAMRSKRKQEVRRPTIGNS